MTPVEPERARFESATNDLRDRLDRLPENLRRYAHGAFAEHVKNLTELADRWETAGQDQGRTA